MFRIDQSVFTEIESVKEMLHDSHDLVYYCWSQTYYSFIALFQFCLHFCIIALNWAEIYPLSPYLDGVDGRNVTFTQFSG